MSDPRWVVDSSGWIEYFTDGPNAGAFAAAIEQPLTLLVPSLSLLEVFKWMQRRHGEGAAVQAVALMQQGREIALDTALALRAAQLGLEWRLPLADSVMLATAQAHQAILLTQDSDFAAVPGVRYWPKQG